MIKDIERHVALINASLQWAADYGKDSFPREQFRDYRRRLNKIGRALSGNCSAAAYGESQVGKSYLMSSLLSSADSPFVIRNAGRDYSFIDEINPSGGNNAKIESTGVITRFTLQRGPAHMRHLVRIQTLSVVDIISLLVDSYYNDVKLTADTVMPYDVINSSLEQLSTLWAAHRQQHAIISDDDVKDVCDYIKEVIGSPAAAVCQSKFRQVIAPVIQYIPVDRWVEVFGLLWNENPQISRLFSTLIAAYAKLEFNQDIYVPFDAVLRSRGTLLKIEWLDSVCGVKVGSNDEQPTTDVYDSQGRLLASDYSKGDLSALIAELTFELPEQLAADRAFLREMDLLDFPGARSREKFKEGDLATVLPKMLRRGKVAYLFNKYSRSLQISSVLFCHHNDQKAEPTLGETINSWIEENIGSTAAQRTEMLKNTDGIAPLFMVATKFNIDLERSKNDRPGEYDTLDKHWNRFDTVLPEIIKPNRWMDEWTVDPQGRAVPFRNLYPLRDFYWSGKGLLFDGYSDGDSKSPETAVHRHGDYPDYMDRLKQSFVRHGFVQRHFADPSQAWEQCASLNNDGSKVIIAKLDRISGLLDQARRNKYARELQTIRREMLNTLQVYYEPEDSESKNRKVRQIAGDIRRSLMQTVSTNPAAFGRIIDSLMINAGQLRDIAYDIIVCHKDTPKDFNDINFIRARAGIDLGDSRQANIQRLLNYSFLDTEAQLREYLKQQNLELDDIISRTVMSMATIGDVVAKHLTDAWTDHLNEQAKQLIAKLPHADEVVLMLFKLFNKLDVRNAMAAKINRYADIFGTTEQLNAIADYAALTFNNFVSNVGRTFMTPDDIQSISAKAANCSLHGLDFGCTDAAAAVRRPLTETLQVLDRAASIVNQGRIDAEVLRSLPFWNNYQRWETLVIGGLVYSSDISSCDPLCNAAVKQLIDGTEALYA